MNEPIHTYLHTYYEDIEELYRENIYRLVCFYEKNPNDQYCSIQAEPKVQKVREKFGETVKQ